MHNALFKLPVSARPWLLAVLAVLLAFGVEQSIEHLVRSRALEQERASVLTDLSTLHVRLESAVNANLFLLHGLRAVIAAQPDIDQAEFARIASGLMSAQHALRNIAGAPDMVISLMYPVAGNEAAIGLDLRSDPQHNATSVRTMRDGQSVLIGPLPLAEGGVGIIIRTPVFLPSPPSGGEAQFWGLVAAVMDVEALYAQVGFEDVGARLRLALRDTDDNQGRLIFGDAAVLMHNPVTTDIDLPGRTWRLAATPKDGWCQSTMALWSIRLLGLLAALMAGALVWFATRGNQALAASEAHLRTLLAAIPDPIWLKDAAGVYRSCNLRCAQFLGLPTDQIVGQTDRDLFPREIAETFQVHDRAAIASGGPCIYEETLICADDGRDTLLETVKTPLYAPDGRLIGILGIARDITARTQAEAELRRQKETLDRTGHFAKVGGWELDVATLEGSWTDEAARIHDLDPDTPLRLSERLSSFQGPSRALLKQALQDLIETGRPYELELELITVKGTRKWVHTIGLPVWEDGRVVRAEGTIQDVTTRRHAEIQASERQAILSAVFQVLPDLFFRVDPDGTIRDYHASQNGDLYAAPDRFLGRRVQEVLPAPAAARFDDHMARISATGELVSYEYDLPMPDGTHHFEMRLVLLPCGIERIALVRDITERKRAEDAIRQLNTELEARVAARTAELAAINQELETFTYSVSHDLKAPLRGVDGYSRLLLEDHGEQLNAEGRLFLANIRRGAEQMNQLIEDLLAYSRMERRSLDVVAVNLRQNLECVLVEHADTIAALKGSVEVDIDVALSVRADPDGLAMVLRNLLDNALKFTRPDEPPRIEISARTGADSVLLIITDHGIGFDMQFHDRIFQTFQRLQRAEDYPGTGIGLAIVHKALQRMGGNIRAQSVSGEGATFLVELPQA